MDLSWVLYFIYHQLPDKIVLDRHLCLRSEDSRDMQGVLRAITFVNDLWRPPRVTHGDGLKKLESKLSPGAWRREPSQRRLHKYMSVSDVFFITFIWLSSSLLLGTPAWPDHRHSSPGDTRWEHAEHLTVMVVTASFLNSECITMHL